MLADNKIKLEWMEDKMYLREFYDGIGVPAHVRKALGTIALSDGEADAYWKEFEQDIPAFYSKILEKEHYRLWFLRLYLLFAWKLYPRFAARGISLQIYLDTFRDIMNWEENCERDFHEVGLEQYDWIRLHLQMRLFKLGRLQYEVVQAGNEPVALNGRMVLPGETALNLHIPQGEPLELQKCRESLEEADIFFHGNYKEITCHSWLLGPALKELLGEDSNIVRFQGLFEIYGLDNDSKEAQERTFGINLREDTRYYPENTRLQRAMKAYLCAGGKVGSALGRVREA